jgi:hypothetical protein
MAIHNTSIQQIAKARGINIPDEGIGLSTVLILLEEIRSDGAIVVIKLDGTPQASQPYVVIVTSGPLHEDHVKSAAPDLEQALASAIVNYARRCWQVQPSTAEHPQRAQRHRK